MPDYNPVRNKADELALKEGYYWDPAGSDRVIKFITTQCALSKGEWAGQLISLILWQVIMIRQLYSWFRPDGTRRFRTGLIVIPKKSGKSSIISALAIYHLLADNEQGAEVICAARNRAQASIVFNEAATMVKASPGLQKYLKVVPYQKRITFEKTNSVFKALSADVESHDGINASYSICDELHLWLLNKAKLYNILRYAGAARRQPMLVAITTAGRDRSSICYEQYKYSKQVAEGIIPDFAHYSQIYEADETDDWRDEKVWMKANPSLGTTIKLEDMRADAAKAQNDPSALLDFKQFRLNIWVSRENTWLDQVKWDACGNDNTIPPGSDVYLGWDLSCTQDITALVMVAKVNDTWCAQSWFWIPEDQASLRYQNDNLPYPIWHSEKLIDYCPGCSIDYDFVYTKIVALSEIYNIKNMFGDKYVAAQLCMDLERDGFTIEYCGQGGRLSPWIKETEIIINTGKLAHGNNKILTWMSRNTVAITDGMGNKRLQKPSEKSIEKIDGMVALVMALGAGIKSEPDEELWNGTVHWVG